VAAFALYSRLIPLKPNDLKSAALSGNRLSSDDPKRKEQTTTATLIEGTLDEVRKHLNGLSLPLEMRVQVNVTEEAEAKRRERELRAELEQKDANWSRRYGILQIPSNHPLTIDAINELRED